MNAPAGYVWVSMAWNDDNGNFSGELFSIEIDDEITLEFSPFEGADLVLQQGRTPESFKIGEEEFSFIELHPWFGSMVWDGLLMKEEDALRLMRLAPQVGFTCFEHASDSIYFEAFEKGEKENEQTRKSHA